jgi:hypothetical protein
MDSLLELFNGKLDGSYYNGFEGQWNNGVE